MPSGRKGTRNKEARDWLAAAYCVGGSEKLIDHEPIRRRKEEKVVNESRSSSRKYRGTNAVTITSVFLNGNRPSSGEWECVRRGRPFSRSSATPKTAGVIIMRIVYIRRRRVEDDGI